MGQSRRVYWRLITRCNSTNGKRGKTTGKGKKEPLTKRERVFYFFFLNEDIVYQSVKKSGKRLERGNDYPNSFPSTISSVCCEKKFAASAHI